MALPSELLKFKAPGVKLLTEVVENVPQAIAPSGARVLVVNSRKGPVNTMVLISNFTEYVSTFDAISDADERRGNWGARSAQYMLSVNPIYVLNLRQFDNALDKAGLQELSTATAVANHSSKLVPYSSLYNTQQFWKVDPAQLVSPTNLDNLLIIGNVGASNMSVFIRKTRTTQSTLTFEQWYKNLSRTMPAYVNPTDKVSDWMVDVVIFDNQFNTSSSANTSYGYCFNSDGTVKKSVVNSSNAPVDGLTQLTKIVESGYVTTITGSLIQGFTNEFGNSLDVVQLLNSSIQRLGLVAKLNDKLFDNAAIWQSTGSSSSDGMKKPVPVDFNGHSLCHITSVNTFDIDAYANYESVALASYAYDLSISAFNIETLEETEAQYVTPQPTALTIFTALLPGTYNGTNISLDSKSKIYVNSVTKPSVGEHYVGFDGNLATVKSVTLLGAHNRFFGYGINIPVQPFGDDVNYPESHDWSSFDGDNSFTYVNAGKVFPKNLTNSYYVYPVGHALAGLPIVHDFSGHVVHNPNQANIDNNLYVYQTDNTGNYVLLVLPTVGYTPGTQQSIYSTDIAIERINAYDTDNETTLYATLVANHASVENIYQVDFDKELAINNFGDQDATTFNAITYDATKHVINLVDGTKIYTYNDSKVVHYVKTAEQMATSFKPINLTAYSARTAQFLDGTADRQNTVLNTMLDTSLRDALQNQDLVNWTYIVDGFKSYIEPNCKYQLKTIAEERILGRAIYNMPSIYDFAQSTNPYFKQTEDGQFEAKYITTGGNTELPYSNLFSLPSENGWYGYGFGPNILLSDGKSMPPAAIVSNNFARKYINNKPYVILAGPVDGAIGGQGVVDVEYIFNEKNDGTGDRDSLDPFGYNVILKKTGTGLQIYGNRTSQNTVETPMSSIHTSEIVMYIQTRVKSLLERFVFKYNTAQNRLVIESEANSICSEPFGDGAISGFTNQMNEDNNTAEVIRNRIGILDTTIYANNGMEIIVHRTKIDTVTNTATFTIL